MSTRAISAVWALRGGPEFAPGYRLVLLRLAEVAEFDGSNAFVGVGTIAEDCEVDRRTVQRALRWLQEHEFIEVQHQATNRRSTVYRLTIPGLVEKVAEPVDAVDQERQSAAPTGPVDKQNQGRQNAASGGKIVRFDEGLGRRRGGVGAASTPPDPDPDPRTPPGSDPAREGKGTRAPVDPVEQERDDVYRELVALHDEFVMAPLGARIESTLRQWAEHLRRGDAAKAKEASGEQRTTWSYLQGILGRAAADRAAGVDPWRERDALPSPTARAPRTGGGRGGSARADRPGGGYGGGSRGRGGGAGSPGSNDPTGFRTVGPDDVPTFGTTPAGGEPGQ